MHNKAIATIVVALNLALILYLTDPAVVNSLPFVPNGTLLSIINVIGYSVLGFLITTVVPDFYMDDEYKLKEQATARAIHTVGLCIIYATTLYVFLT